MTGIEGVSTDKAPKPLPQFSQAVKYNGMVYVSGNIGLDAATWTLVEGTVKDRTVKALNNIAAVLEAAGSNIRNIVKVNIFLTTMDNFAAMNEGWDEIITWEPKPCRTCVAVHQLPFGTDVEIECTAFLNPTA
ncbi:putative brt1 protein [Thozetella sp. PMI_491]|nr:putative brt1 protein [Thozetella sp. PMI_491]